MQPAEQFPSETSGISFAAPERRRPNTLPGHRECFAKWDQLHSPRAKQVGSATKSPSAASGITYAMPRRAYFVFHRCARDAANTFWANMPCPEGLILYFTDYYVHYIQSCRCMFQCPEGLVLYFTIHPYQSHH